MALAEPTLEEKREQQQQACNLDNSEQSCGYHVLLEANPTTGQPEHGELFYCQTDKSVSGCKRGTPQPGYVLVLNPNTGWSTYQPPAPTGQDETPIARWLDGLTKEASKAQYKLVSAKLGKKGTLSLKLKCVRGDAVFRAGATPNTGTLARTRSCTLNRLALGTPVPKAKYGIDLFRFRENTKLKGGKSIAVGKTRTLSLKLSFYKAASKVWTKQAKKSKTKRTKVKLILSGYPRVDVQVQRQGRTDTDRINGNYTVTGKMSYSAKRGR